VPAKTQLYVDQTDREKQNAVQMHRTFQRDLYLMRLTAARAYAKTLATGLAPVAATTAVSLKVDAEVGENAKSVVGWMGVVTGGALCA